jgi:hypothetical protein
MTEFEQNVVAEETVTEVTKTGKGKKGLWIGLALATGGVVLAAKYGKKIVAGVKNLFGKKKNATVNCDVEEQVENLFEEN